MRTKLTGPRRRPAPAVTLRRGEGVMDRPPPRLYCRSCDISHSRCSCAPPLGSEQRASRWQRRGGRRTRALTALHLKMIRPCLPLQVALRHIWDGGQVQGGRMASATTRTGVTCPISGCVCAFVTPRRKHNVMLMTEQEAEIVIRAITDVSQCLCCLRSDLIEALNGY